jgi:hypothetical protein
MTSSSTSVPSTGRSWSYYAKKTAEPVRDQFRGSLEDVLFELLLFAFFFAFFFGFFRFAAFLLRFQPGLLALRPFRRAFHQL